jgi:lipoate-protein ligase A
MEALDLSFLSPRDNLLLDDVLLDLAEQGVQGESLRFWESSAIFVVLGRTGRLHEECQLDQLGKDDIPVLRRSSGGGTVLQGPGCLNFSLVLSKDKNPLLGDIRRSYQFILQKIIRVFARLDHEVVFRPASDLALARGELKISGNAQRRGRRYILHHGTVLYGFPLFLIGRYLKMPQDIPQYRRGRGHQDFVANVSLSIADWKQIFREEFSVFRQRQEMTADEAGLLERFQGIRQVMVRTREEDTRSLRDS